MLIHKVSKTILRFYGFSNKQGSCTYITNRDNIANWLGECNPDCVTYTIPQNKQAKMN